MRGFMPSVLDAISDAPPFLRHDDGPPPRRLRFLRSIEIGPPPPLRIYDHTPHPTAELQSALPLLLLHCFFLLLILIISPNRAIQSPLLLSQSN